MTKREPSAPDATDTNRHPREVRLARALRANLKRRKGNLAGSNADNPKAEDPPSTSD